MSGFDLPVVLLRGLAFYTDANMRCGMWVNLVTSPSQIDIIIFMAISSQLRKRKREEKFWAADVDDDAWKEIDVLNTF